MPEGDSLFIAARKLDAVLTGRVVTRFESPLPELKEQSVEGHVVKRVRAQGKHVIIEFDDGRAFLSHLSMQGHWFASEKANLREGALKRAARDVAWGRRRNDVDYRDREQRRDPEPSRRRRARAAAEDRTAPGELGAGSAEPRLRCGRSTVALTPAPREHDRRSADVAIRRCGHRQRLQIGDVVHRKGFALRDRGHARRHDVTTPFEARSRADAPQLEGAAPHDLRHLRRLRLISSTNAAGNIV